MTQAMQSAFSGRSANHNCQILSCVTMQMTDVDLFLELTGVPLPIVRLLSCPLSSSLVNSLLPIIYRSGSTRRTDTTSMN
jgi:hypothetical protein